MIPFLSLHPTLQSPTKPFNQIFLLTDLLFAYIKREFYLKNGYKELRKGHEKGKEGPKLILK